MTMGDYTKFSFPCQLIITFKCRKRANIDKPVNTNFPASTAMLANTALPANTAIPFLTVVKQKYTYRNMVESELICIRVASYTLLRSEYVSIVRVMS